MKAQRFVSWNVNGFRSVWKKDFATWLSTDLPDVICLQETRVKEEQIPKDALELFQSLGYHTHWTEGTRAGYSGTATFSLKPFDEVFSGFASLDPRMAHWDTEGRVTVSRHDDILLFNIYFPNGTSGEERLKYKLDFYEDFQKLCESLQAQGQRVVVCGDVNTSHRDIDLARPKPNRKNSGFLPIECAWIDRFLASGNEGFVDSLRQLHPTLAEAYSWWSFRGGARSRNVGWRLDYFFLSSSLVPRLQSASIRTEVMGSDHCPVEITLDDLE
jgi:exodeoxyribonuclease III